MTRKEIFESYGLRMIWKSGRDDVELSEEETERVRKFAESLLEDFVNEDVTE